MKPWFLLPSQIAHDLLPWALTLLSLFCKNKTPEYKKFAWRGLTFLNPMGIAGGVDKTARNLYHWQKLGVGFLEVGTLTPLPQGPNSGKIVDRNIATESLWNKMGFPNAGADSALEQIVKLKPYLHVPLFVNIGKNRTTNNELAFQDYIQCINKLKGVADVFVINISSPNTQGLRQLLTADYFKKFLTPILEHKAHAALPQPFLLKLSPDMTEAELRNVLDISLELKIDGWILTNTTTDREQTPFFSAEGGMSGKPLAKKSKALLKICSQHLQGQRTDQLIISAGGISSPAEVQERLDLGANLVQVYSALAFQGPLFFRNCLEKLQSNAQLNRL